VWAWPVSYPTYQSRAATTHGPLAHNSCGLPTEGAHIAILVSVLFRYPVSKKKTTYKNKLGIFHPYSYIWYNNYCIFRNTEKYYLLKHHLQSITTPTYTEMSLAANIHSGTTRALKAANTLDQPVYNIQAAQRINFSVLDYQVARIYTVHSRPS
jgi:hypothetical protein